MALERPLAWIDDLLWSRVLGSVVRRAARWVGNDSAVFDVGCGSGTLLLQLAPRIRRGVGVDDDPVAVERAMRRSRRARADHLRFDVGDVAALAAKRAGLAKDGGSATGPKPRQFDVATAILALSKLPAARRVALLQVLRSMAPRLVCAEFTRPLSAVRAAGIDLLQRMTDEHEHYDSFLRDGGLSPLLDTAGFSLERRTNPIDGICVCLALAQEE